MKYRKERERDKGSALSFPFLAPNDTNPAPSIKIHLGIVDWFGLDIFFLIERISKNSEFCSVLLIISPFLLGSKPMSAAGIVCKRSGAALEFYSRYGWAALTSGSVHSLLPSNFAPQRCISQLVKTNGKRAFLVDTLALVVYQA